MMTKSNDPIALLKHDHETVKKLFKSIDKSSAKQEELFDQIRTQLEIHTTIEEEIFYPAVAKMQSASAKDEIREARHEHAQVKKILQKMERMEPDNEKFEASLKELEQDVEHHVHEEETEIFPDARKHMEEDELSELGQQLSARKKELEKADTKGGSRDHPAHHASK
jgi:iron-sulfur cluster repair protein YtfE (RIC family)